MKFPRTKFHTPITIEQLISFHYFEYAHGYVFEGEHHDFWEILYVDKGTVEVQSDDRIHELQQGQLIFHKPDEFHTVRVHSHHKPPNLIVISFDCSSPSMLHFQEKIVSLTDRERNMLSLILQEGFATFAPPYNDPNNHVLTRAAHAPFGSEQIMKSYLEVLLIYLLRPLLDPSNRNLSKTRLSSAQKENADRLLLEQIQAYMKENVARPMNLDHLCQTFHMGKSRLKDIFQSLQGTGVLEYFKSLKIKEAKTLIREGTYNFTEIAELLGYSSIHYFSREFKVITGMSPSEYAKSTKARAQE